MKNSSFMLFSGSSHPKFAEEVARNLEVPLGSVLIENFPDGEVGAQILENVRGKDVFILQSVARRPNHYFMELLILVDAFKRASARSIIAVLPYYPYARQDRKDKGRVPITAKLVADLLERAGVTRLLTMDLHTEQIQGFFNIPVDNLYARPLFVQALKRMNLKKSIVVSPDVGSNRMARKYAEDLKTGIAMIDKRRVSAKKVEICALIGDVKEKEVILVDDICSTGGTLRTAAKVCRKEGAKRILAAVSHGLFVGEGLPEGIDEFLITNSVPSSGSAKDTKVKTVSVAGLFAQAIDCVIKAKSISMLFRSES